MAAVSGDEQNIQCMICHEDHTDINEDPNLDMTWKALKPCHHPVHQACIDRMMTHNREHYVANVCPTCRAPFSRRDIENINEGVELFAQAERADNLGPFLCRREPYAAAWDCRSGSDTGESLPERASGSLLRSRVHTLVADFYEGLVVRISFVVNAIVLTSCTVVLAPTYGLYSGTKIVHAFIVDRAEECFYSIFEKAEFVARLVFGPLYAVKYFTVSLAYLTKTVVDGIFDMFEECCV